MRRVSLDKAASAVSRLEIGEQVYLSDEIVPRAGHVIAVRTLDRKDRYNLLEDRHGRMLQLYPGDIVAGVLGERRALQGHAGIVPESVAVGDTIHMLNLGGVMGLCTSSNPGVGPAMRLEVLGAVLSFPVLESRQGVPAHLGMNALEPIDRLELQTPVVFISGTCMNAGKTAAACAIVRLLHARGLKVAAAKLTGVALQRDVLAMRDCGAVRTHSFCDAGFPSTGPDTAAPAARAVLGALAAAGLDAPDVIIAELGDGLLGEYGVMKILEQPDIAQLPAVHVCCASDPVGAFGAVEIFAARLNTRPDLLTGPATDNDVGCRYIEGSLGIPARNALLDPDGLGTTVNEALETLQGAGRIWGGRDLSASSEGSEEW